MNYPHIIGATFLRRPNRFIAHVDIDGVEQVVHVKNTGRCNELLLPGARVYLAQSDNPARKTRHDLISVVKKRPCGDTLLVNMDSQVPNDVAAEWLPRSGLFSPQATFRREVTWHSSRFDFHVQDETRSVFLEVKGVTLENDGIASFPDAPTERGVKYLHELMACQKDGHEAMLLFVIQMKGIREMRPSDVHHLEFAETLRAAAQNGVTLLAMDCVVTPDSIAIDAPVPLNLAAMP